jgi:5-formyltetrahydrofolate cyclo-ligase
MIKDKKKQIRKETLQKRDGLIASLREQWDREIFKQVITLPAYIQAKKIFIFVSFGSEVDTHLVISHAFSQEKEVYVPRVISKQEGMEICKITKMEDLQKGYFGVLEPKCHCTVGRINEIDLIFMPGVAFDRQNGRLGYGGGFYDRFLQQSTKGIPKVALAYSIQVIESVPMGEFDKRVDQLITND